ncbi:metal-dependent transcriptional regulator [Halorhabdus sp. CBA1104]|uniref:metal-dependent transcriptional regulator n=1 Tax=unclassified Halorhabdus TaxID=2621901 RepID=UPI0012B18ADA|nr:MULTISPECIES: metal-dependent transcriptional regulator [unclassified Halorhabdus]QGN05879.1 metal-dependent transcriptional regulator [Halorhabdus sp. CBA1104]
MTSTRQTNDGVTLSDHSITRTGGKYLCGLFRCALAGRDRVATGTLATRLDVSRASVTEMIEKFGAGTLVDHEHYRGATLTADGEALARHLQWRRCVTQRFFEGELGLDIDVDRAYHIGFELPVEGLDRLASLVDHGCDRHCQASAASECPQLTISTQ